MNGDGLGLSKELEASPTIKVEIYDQAYTVRSDGDPEYLKQLAGMSISACGKFLPAR